MTKTELEQQLASQLGLSRAAARDLLNAVLDAITLALSRQRSVTLPGFGSFAVRQLAARQGRNPQTGEPLNVAASKSVLFRPGSRLRAAVSAAPSEHAQES